MKEGKGAKEKEKDGEGKGVSGDVKMSLKEGKGVRIKS